MPTVPHKTILERLYLSSGHTRRTTEVGVINRLVPFVPTSMVRQPSLQDVRPILVSKNIRHDPNR